MGRDNCKIYFKVAKSIALEAGKLLLDKFHDKREIGFKGRIDLVTEMDTRSEEFIVNSIKKHFPDHGILAEEGNKENTGAEYLWIIDPLDGTTNYAHGFGFFCVSIALAKKDEGIIVGVVYAPYLNECYTAVKGEGAYLNGKKIKVSEIGKLEQSLLATGFPYDIKESHANIDHFNRFLMKAQAVRRPGSAAIDMCAVAAGKFDGFWELKLNPWDVAAGSLIIREAGGDVTDFKGGFHDIYKQEILASNGLIHEDMREVINGG
ncbi:inositol monophosphatase family protein [Elusimicrobiota bacterium]